MEPCWSTHFADILPGFASFSLSEFEVFGFNLCVKATPERKEHTIFLPLPAGAEFPQRPAAGGMGTVGTQFEG